MSGKPKGFIPVMLTPFNENGAVDYDGLTSGGIVNACQALLLADQRTAGH